MTNREYLNSLGDEEFVKYLRKNTPMTEFCMSDLKHERTKRCDKMGNDCIACRLDWLKAEREVEE